jgi:hypothetical protein
MHCFFHISTPGFQKWTKIIVHFQKSSFRFEKKKHHSLLGGLGVVVFPANKVKGFLVMFKGAQNAFPG